MEYTDLLEILLGDIDRIKRVNVEDVALFDTNVTVRPFYVKKILHDYLSGKISSSQLNSWALFVCLRGEYSCPNWQDDEFADHYEDMFYVIQKLSTPKIDGEINPDRVKEYLFELSKYDD